jgi:tetratricopeptide (TPR) repeat protein
MCLLKQIGEQEGLDIQEQNRHKGFWNSSSLVIAVFLVLVGQNLYGQNEIELSKAEETLEMQYEIAFSEGLRYKMLGNPVEAGKSFATCTKLIESKPAPYYELGSLALRIKDLPAAEGFAQTALSLDPENRWYRLLLIEILTRSERFEEAAELYYSLFEKYPDSPEYLIAQIEMLVKASNDKSALKQIKKLAEFDGLDAEAALREKDIYLRMGNEKKAISTLAKLVDKYPNQIEYRGIFAELLAEKGFNEEALKQYEIIKSSNPDNPIVYYSLGQFYMDLGRKEQAIAEFETGFRSKQVNPEIKVNVFMELVKGLQGQELSEELVHLLQILYEADHGYPAVDDMYANYLYSKENFDEAEDIYKRLVDVNPGGFMAWQNLLMIQNQQLDFAEMYLIGDKAIKAYPNQSLFYLFKGIAANALNKYDDAVETLKKGSRLNSGNSDITKQYYISLGDALYHTGNFEEAYKNFDLLLVLDSENAIVLNNYAYYLSVQGIRLEKALEMIEKCIAIEPENTTYLDTQAWVYFKLGNYGKAKEIIEKVIAAGSENLSGEVMEHYGDILFKNGLVEEALAAWKKASLMEGVGNLIDQKIEQKKIIDE